MWCKKCNRETVEEICEICKQPTEQELPIKIYWCNNCKVPIIIQESKRVKHKCNNCKSDIKYLSSDLRPVFPEERLLLELLVAKPFEFENSSVWVVDSRYFVDGKAIKIASSVFKTADIESISNELEKYKHKNSYDYFNNMIEKFISANKDRLSYIIDEAMEFVQETSKEYPRENVVVSFSGGKDSTVTADVTKRALSDPNLVYIFGDTTLEFDSTMEYVKRFRADNPKAILKSAKNKEQNFFEVCEDIGPPARMLRWCCSMFKTGPITRVINSFYNDSKILTFYGIRKCESVSRSKYNRVEDDAETVKIQQQKVASPIFLWKDIDIWLYILGEKIDFNDAYRLGYDRVGCWCCPNNSERTQFLSKIYMSERAYKWREFLIDFAKKIGKPDPEVYVDDGKWKARQGGNGLKSAEDVKIKFTNCTAEENAKIYKLTKEIDDYFIQLFIPLGKISTELGRKMVNETIILDYKTNIPIIAIQPFSQNEYDYSVKIKTMNVDKHDDLQKKIGYQIRKYNACRNCLKCESLCKFGAISIVGDFEIYQYNAS